jgi:hypothetical protein
MTASVASGCRIANTPKIPIEIKDDKIQNANSPRSGITEGTD